ncbi:MAG TPA: acyl-CoA dehydrogenase, partial [Kofleriaceae bacterium]|nr:acyl-CoA dehydrogenase [Kofleriaceae bacterium]
MTASAYRVNARELAFVLWELFDAEKQFLGTAPYHAHDRAHYEALIDRAREFALEMGKSYRASDIEGCTLDGDGGVHLPADYYALWERYRAEWVPVFGHAIPPLVTQIIFEMFMGANPSFMTYGGFTRPAIKLLNMHGTPRQREFLPKLATYTWDACFCATEPQAGSDLTAVVTEATPLAGESPETYALSGQKIFISAGMHSLTENTLYFVLGRVAPVRPDSYSLSCFVVPRFWPNPATGALEPNHVECIDLPRKMGLKGCANTHLVFGRSGTTRALLLNNRKNVGLLQLVPLMNQARMSTGMYGVGIASTAYLHAVEYARTRFQGRAIDRASDSAAPRVKIIEHADVQRMLLEMKCRVDGCRGMLGKLAATASRAAMLEAAPGADQPEQRAKIDRHRKLQLLLTPICKAFISDQAWKICELAIQVHGGVGYTDAAPVEQHARDVKILSIWEGTNYIQAQDLVRDKLGFGRNSKLIRYFREELDGFLAAASDLPADDELAPLAGELARAADRVELALDHISGEVRAGRTRESSQFYTRFLEMFGFVVAGWVLLESACIARRRLAAPEVIADPGEAAFYRGKRKTALYFFANVLP